MWTMKRPRAWRHPKFEADAFPPLTSFLRYLSIFWFLRRFRQMIWVSSSEPSSMTMISKFL